MIALIRKLKTILTGSWRIKTRRPNIPKSVKSENYAIIKLRKFNDLPVAVMVDESRPDQIMLSYDDSRYDAATKKKISNEIMAILSYEIDEMMEEEEDGSL